MSYFYGKKSSFSFLETLDEVLLAFSEKGFGLVSNIDVSERIRKKVDKNFGNYKILGFCQPELANKYLSEDMNLGVFLPCSVVVYELDGDTYISTGLPDDIIGKIVNNDNIKFLDKDVSILIKEIIDSID